MRSYYFQAMISPLEHPNLYRFLVADSSKARFERLRGQAKKFVCDAAERALSPEQATPKAECGEDLKALMRQLDEIKEMLSRGVAIRGGAENVGETHSEKASDRLRRLGL